MTHSQLMAKLKLCQRKHRYNQSKVVDFTMGLDCLLQYIGDKEGNDDIEREFNKIERPFPYDN